MDLKYYTEKTVEAFIDLCNELEIDDRVKLVNIIRDTLWENRDATYRTINCDDVVKEIKEQYNINE